MPYHFAFHLTVIHNLTPVFRCVEKMVLGLTGDGYWYIHGKAYDMTPFIENHPGGEYMISLGKGRDCTELFESVHALKGGKPHQLLEKYRVKEIQPKEEEFSWEANGFYATLCSRVEERLLKGNRSLKATWFTKIKIVAMFVLLVVAWSKAVVDGNWIFAVASGTLTEMIGFCMMHDGSHGALSKKPLLNFVGTLWCGWMFWGAWSWLQHHVYAHHSYTGIFGSDPDVVNLQFLCRKHKSAKPNKIHAQQSWSVWLLMLVMPNQHVGQVMMYFSYSFTDFLFGIRTTPAPGIVIAANLVVMAISFLFHIVFPFYVHWDTPVIAVKLLFVHFTFMGINYFINVAPNHDTMETFHNHPPDGTRIDWGEQQVRASGNHNTDGGLFSTLVTELWGGMNYQIEHHLFPAVCHTHMPEIAAITKQTAKEFGIPYNDHVSWLGSLISFGRLIDMFSTLPWIPKYQKNPSKKAA